MAETLGTLCDKLTIANLKKWHCDDEEKLISLELQIKELKIEIDTYIENVISGNHQFSIVYKSNKVYKEEGNEIRDFSGTMSCLFSDLLRVNLDLWRTQDMVYDFEKVPENKKNNVVKRLAILNLERNKCMELLDSNLETIISRVKN